MSEKRSSPAWKVACVVAAVCLAVPVGWFLFTMANISHDKSVNSRLQILWLDARGIPLGTVVPAKNRWMDNAFVAEACHERDKAVAVLVLDDHYRSDDPLYRSESGVIGDAVNKTLLCSVPAQAQAKNVRLDRVVQRLIDSECGDGTA